MPEDRHTELEFSFMPLAHIPGYKQTRKQHPKKPLTAATAATSTHLFHAHTSAHMHRHATAIRPAGYHYFPLSPFFLFAPFSMHIERILYYKFVLCTLAT